MNITRMVKQANEELEQATGIAGHIHFQQPVLQEVINAANLAAQAATTLNRLVGYLILHNQMMEAASKNQTSGSPKLD